ncbi:MAG: caa(3)-type oxidase subunit IV [Planctomycetes bacterium]|nr:caa(3)-type oxidase subunit IV [Planctomycetota bacterium]
MSDQSPSTHDDSHDHGVGHIVPVRILVATGFGLLVLTWITVFVAGIDLGEANIYVALGIAVLKATLVALFFMHLRWDRPFNAIVFVSAVGFVALFLALAMTDSAEYQADIHPGDAKAVIEATGQ